MAGTALQELNRLGKRVVRGQRKAMRAKRAAGRLKRNIQKGKTGKAQQNRDKLIKNTKQFTNQAGKGVKHAQRAGEKGMAAAKNFR